MVKSRWITVSTREVHYLLREKRTGWIVSVEVGEKIRLFYCMQDTLCKSMELVKLNQITQ